MAQNTAEYEFIDHLNEYVAGLAKKYLADRTPEDLPAEFKGISTEKLIYLIADGATPILRKIEHDAIEAAMERAASLIRYYKKNLPSNKRGEDK